MAAIKYMVVRRISDARTREVILKASEGPEFINAEQVRDQIQRIAGDSDLVKMVLVNIETTPVKDLKNAWRDAVAYPISPDGSVSFDNAYFPPNNTDR